MTENNSLTPNDWIQAGFHALTAGGPQAIKVEAIARQMHVSKGSFYWHFKNLPELKSAMLAHWLDNATHSVIDLVEDSQQKPQDQLRLLIQIATGGGNEPYGGILVEAAIRDWSRHDKLAASTLITVDQLRLKYLRKLFKRCGMSAKICTRNANNLYAALIGLEHLDHHGIANLKRDLPGLLEMMLLSQ
ncbi:MAG: TetR/AcrR family transcriptional regulator [Granulosicoccus sp.]